MSLLDELIRLRLDESLDASSRRWHYYGTIASYAIPGWFNFLQWVLVLGALHVLDRVAPSTGITVFLQLSYALLTLYVCNSFSSVMVAFTPETTLKTKRWWILCVILGILVVFLINRIVEQVATGIARRM
jgi:hypothetical protein